MQKAMIELKNVSKYYYGDNNVSLGMRRVNLKFERGEFVAITGESGAGKSTLLNVLSGLDGYEEGEMTLFDEPTSHFQVSDLEYYRAKHVGFIFQNYNIIDSYSVYQNVLLALDIQGYDKKEKRERAVELIEKVGLKHRLHHKASKLSGGEKQRAVIARALAKDCPIIAADEPTGNLDSESGAVIMRLLQEISKDKLVIVVTHNYQEVEKLVTRRIKMHDGEVIEDVLIGKQAETAEADKTRLAPKNLSFPTLMNFVFRNIFSTPKKMIFVMLMFILVIGSFTIVYASCRRFISEIGSMMPSQVYGSIPESRMVVTKRDFSNFSQEDYDYFEDMLGDDSYLKTHAEIIAQVTQNVFMRSSIRTDYSSYLKTSDIKEYAKNRGPNDLLSPINPNDVFVSDDLGFSVGDLINNYFSKSTITDFYVAGLVKAKTESTIYFNDLFVEQTIEDISNDVHGIMHLSLSIPMTADKTWNKHLNFASHIVFDDNVPKDVVVISNTYVDEFVSSNIDVDVILISQYYSVQYEVKLMIGDMDDDIIVMNEETYNDIISKLITDNEVPTTDSYYHLSVNVSSKQYAARLIENIDSVKYRVFYPENVVDMVGQLIRFIAIIGIVAALTILGFLLFFILSIVTKNVMVARKKDFAIYRSIGAQQRSLSLLVIMEQVIYGILSFIVCLLFFVLLFFTTEYFKSAFYVINMVDIFVVFFIVLLLSIRLGFNFNRRVFEYSVIQTLTGEGVSF